MEPSPRAVPCPNCGAPAVFTWSGSVQATCRFCRSVLVRTDVDAARIGEWADLAPDPSPFQLGVRGAYRGLAFGVIGRIVYAHETGRWNEWHLLFADGASGWLSDAQLQYAVTRLRPGVASVPPAGKIRIGGTFTWDDVAYQVTAITRARYAGVEGELPFRTWGRETATFVDLRTADRRFATIDYSDGEDAPAVYLGASVDVADLALAHLRRFEGWTA